jgi:hypothetical protein
MSFSIEIKPFHVVSSKAKKDQRTSISTKKKSSAFFKTELYTNFKTAAVENRLGFYVTYSFDNS